MEILGPYLINQIRNAFLKSPKKVFLEKDLANILIDIQLTGKLSSFDNYKFLQAVLEQRLLTGTRIRFFDGNQKVREEKIRYYWGHPPPLAQACSTAICKWYACACIITQIACEL